MLAESQMSASLAFTETNSDNNNGKRIQGRLMVSIS